MESSQIAGDDGEECNSNESGWTTYLASPTSSRDDAKEYGSEESNVEDGSGYIIERRQGKEANNADDDGDYDSLASDASTGPAQVKVLEGKDEKDRQTSDGCSDGHDGKDEKEEMLTKFSTSGNKKAGKMKKADEKTSKRGHGRRRSSSRTSFFW